MLNDPTLFQYCPKLVLFSEDRQSVLLARRQGEADYDGTFTFVGGKTEATDGDLLAGLQREKNEEIGKAAQVDVCWRISCYQVWFQKQSGQSMVIPHHVALYRGGEIELNADEYAEYRWVPVAGLASFEPIVANIPDCVAAAQRLLPVLGPDDFSRL
jgi:8-oxo-dGTP pyrophosphatase MutT (NUDIX family)